MATWIAEPNGVPAVADAGGCMVNASFTGAPTPTLKGLLCTAGRVGEEEAFSR